MGFTLFGNQTSVSSKYKNSLPNFYEIGVVIVSVADIRTYVYGATYDSWNRVQTMTYPDGEVVTYHYNAAGQVESMTSNKQGRQSVMLIG